MYVCVCMYVYTHTYTHVRTYTHTSMQKSERNKKKLNQSFFRQIYKEIHTFIHTLMHAYTRERKLSILHKSKRFHHSDMLIHTYTCTHIHTHIHTREKTNHFRTNRNASIAVICGRACCNNRAATSICISIPRCLLSE